jgi:tRNA threonylcarbamoyladenosine biosynthesis protein TsaB
VDSTLGVGSVALAAAGVVRGARTAAGDGKGKLPRLVGELLEAQGLAPRDVEAVVVGAGPGRFTGVRSAVAVAKGLAWALAVPVAAVGSLEALAAAAAGEAGAWIVLGDGPRNLYVVAPGDDEAVASVDLAAFVAARMSDAGAAPTFAGTALGPLREALREAGCAAKLVEYELDAAAHLAVALLGARVVAAHDLEPTYVREASITAPKVAPPLLAFR